MGKRESLDTTRLAVYAPVFCAFFFDFEQLSRFVDFLQEK
jgi:hypothetical protein